MIKTKHVILLLLCCFMGSNLLNAQKAKFKNDIIKIQKTRLPINFIDPANRTYNLYKKGAYSINVESHEKGIYGWQIDRENPQVKGVVSLYGFSLGSPRKSSQKKTKKDKEGNVTDTWTEYKYTGSATGNGTLYVYGQSNPFEYKKKPKKKSKGQLAREAKEAEAAKELEANPFLSSEDIVEAEESDIGEDTGLDSEVLPLINTHSLNISKDVETGTHRSSSAAYKDYVNNKRPVLYNFRNEFAAKAYNNAINRMNYLYGYTPVNNRVYLKRMKSEKHAEFKTWNDACQATETLFKAFKYNKSIEANQPKFQPIVDYFYNVVQEIPDSDRKGKKMKAAAYQNMMNILFYLDQHDEVIRMCNENLASKALDKQSKRMLAKSEKLKAHLAFHNVSTCHIESLDEINEDDIEVGEIQEEEMADSE